MQFRVCHVLAIVFFLVAPALPASAQEKYPVGRVVALEGTANFGSAPAHPDDPVYMYNAISTGPESKILILLIDDTEITLGENSELVIDEFVFDPYDSEENKARISVARGVFQWISGTISKREEPDVSIRTAFGSIGIRGTIVWGGQTDGGYGVFVQEGEALVQTIGGGSVIVPSGTGTIIPDPGATPKPANAWRQERVDAAVKTVTFGNTSRIRARMEDQMIRNIERRHEYRKIMWPYKPSPWIPPSDIEDNRSQDFKEQGERHEQRMEEHDQRIRNGAQ